MNKRSRNFNPDCPKLLRVHVLTCVLIARFFMRKEKDFLTLWGSHLLLLTLPTAMLPAQNILLHGCGPSWNVWKQVLVEMLIRDLQTFDIKTSKLMKLIC